MADAEGNIRDLSKVITQIDDNTLAPRNLARLARVKPETLPIVRGSPRLGVPYAGISKFVAIGLNYSDHAAESNLPIPSEPVVFSKATTCLCGPYDDTIMSRERFAGLPGVATLIESGYAAFEATSWNGISVPASTPDPIAEILAKAFRDATSGPEVQKALRSAGVLPRTSTGAEMTQRVAADVVKWRAVIEKEGIPRL